MFTCRQPENISNIKATANTPEKELITAAVVDTPNTACTGGVGDRRTPILQNVTGKNDENFSSTQINANSFALNKKDIQQFGRDEKQLPGTYFVLFASNKEFIINY